jgi:hypothetical protein
MFTKMAEALNTFATQHNQKRKGVKIVRGSDGRPSHTEDIYD